MDKYNNTLYEVLFFWNNTKDKEFYVQYCAETLTNILGYTPSLSVKLVYEALERHRTLVFSSRNSDKATEIRDQLLALDMNCKIHPIHAPIKI